MLSILSCDLVNDTVSLGNAEPMLVTREMVRDLWYIVSSSTWQFYEYRYDFTTGCVLTSEWIESLRAYANISVLLVYRPYTNFYSQKRERKRPLQITVNIFRNA